MTNEKILCSSIYFDDGVVYEQQPVNILTGFTVQGRRHSDCFMTMYILTKKSKEFLTFEKTQGFLTDTNRFVTREEAWTNAQNAGQIKEDSHRFTQRRLFSEDLY